MKLLALTDLIIPPNRQREEESINEKKVAELAESISRVGLLQPIVLRDDSRTLVCGRHRTKAVARLSGLAIPLDKYRHDATEIPVSHVPFVCVGELSPEALFEAELEENIRRTDLSWQQRTRAIAKLHELRVKLNPEHTIKATAAEVLNQPKESVKGAQITNVSNALLLAQFLDDPIVSACPDEASARKAIKDELTRQEKRRRLSHIDATSTRHKLIIGSCYTEMAPPGTFDCIVTDPPYGINIHKKDTFDQDKHEYDDSEEAFQEVCSQLPKLAARACKPDAHIYVFCDIRRFTDLLVAFEVGGWSCWPRPLIWDKGNIGSFGNIEYGFRSCYDAILFARRGDRKVTAGYRDVIPITQSTKLPHPAGKPVDLYIELLRRSCLPGDTVGDFYCGHGPIFAAAHKLQLTAWGWELNEKYAALAQDTLKEIGSETIS